jgi:myo-inositol-1(or 4)-monophosphatase
VLGEEREDIGSPQADFVWVIDPVDGTVNFASGLPLFAVSIGVLHRGAPVAGAIYLSCGPNGQPAVTHARRGGGCFLGEQRLSAFAEPELHPSRPAALPAAFWRRFRFGRGLRWRPIEVRTLGSIAYELTLIAAGALQFGVYRAPRIRDVAAGVTLVREAGGIALQWDERQASWVPIEHFVAPRRRSGEPGPLRDWALPVLLGGSAVTTFAAQNLRPRRGLHARLWALLWRLFGG